MDRDLHRLRAVTEARDRLRKAAFKYTPERLPQLISFSQDWLDQFKELRDAELFTPVTSRTGSPSSFWGCPIAIEPLGGQAVVEYQGGARESVQLVDQ